MCNLFWAGEQLSVNEIILFDVHVTVHRDKFL